MKIKFILVIAICTLLAIVLLILIIRNIFLNQTATEIQNQNSLSPTVTAATSSVTSGIPQVVRIQPLPEASNVALDTNIELFFRTTVNIKDIFVEIVPEVSFTLLPKDNQITVQLDENLQPGILYAVNVGYRQRDSISFVFQSNFTTSGPTALPIQYDSLNIVKSDLEYARINDPDLFLSNNVPYTGTNFSIQSVSFLDENGAANYRFEVKPNRNASQITGEVELTAWLESLKITRDIRQKLSITWVNNEPNN